MIKDSGIRRTFESGGVRDIQDGKGKCDLLPLHEVYELLEYPFWGRDKESPVRCISAYVDSAKANPFGIGEAAFIYSALHLFAKEIGWDIPTMVLEVSKHFEEGAAKYKRNNWRLGLPASCYLDSGLRHYLKWLRGDEDERHDRAFVWNMLCMVWTVRNRPECNDLPNIEECPDD